MNESTVNFDQPHKEFLRALIKGNLSTCSDLVYTYKKKPTSIQDLYEKIIKKAMYEVGDLWEYNKISVATEHLASAVVESILNQLYLEILSYKKINKKVITTCVEDEYHQIGIKMISDIFEMNGWNSFFLGSNTPTDALMDLIQEQKPDLLAVSLSLYFNLPKMENLILKVHDKFPDLPILLGGQAFEHGGVDVIKKYNNVIYKPDLYSTELFIKNFKNHG